MVGQVGVRRGSPEKGLDGLGAHRRSLLPLLSRRHTWKMLFRNARVVLQQERMCVVRCGPGARAAGLSAPSSLDMLSFPAATAPLKVKQPSVKQTRLAGFLRKCRGLSLRGLRRAHTCQILLFSPDSDTHTQACAEMGFPSASQPHDLTG